jgi:Tol biopolymer transport system component
MTRQRSIYLSLAAILAVGPGACADATGPREAPIEQLLFFSTRGDGQLRGMYRMNADGTGVENLTVQPSLASGTMLSLSRDGTRIAHSMSSGGCGIWVMSADGSNPIQLTNRPGSPPDGCNHLPRWSRDGRQIAFLSNREGRQNEAGTIRGLYDVYVMNADGSNPRNVSHVVAQFLGFNVEVISWSADGRVVFQTSDEGSTFFQRFVYIVKPDGTGMRPLFNRPGDNSPFWSPDGSKVVFVSARDGRRRLYVMNADGSGERPLTSAGPGDDHLPAWFPGFGSGDVEYDPWSPDGKRIAFERWGDTVTDKQVIHVINADGSGLRALTGDRSQFNGWSPSGQRIAFTKWAGVYTGPYPEPEIFVVNADGSGIVNVTNHAAADSHAMWVVGR